METDLSEQDCLALKSLIVAEDPANDLAAAFERSFPERAASETDRGRER